MKSKIETLIKKHRTEKLISSEINEGELFGYTMYQVIVKYEDKPYPLTIEAILHTDEQLRQLESKLKKEKED
jgi:hypothetical protein